MELEKGFGQEVGSLGQEFEQGLQDYLLGWEARKKVWRHLEGY